MMLSIGKIFWLLVILALVWYGFKIIERRKIKPEVNDKNKDNRNKKGIDAFKCSSCGLCPHKSVEALIILFLGSDLKDFAG